MLTSYQLVERKTRAVVVESLELADGYWSRLVGLQFRSRLPAGRGLLLVPCPSIHTFFVRFAIDVVALDRRGQVVAVRNQVRPWRIVLPPKGTFAILELPAGTVRLNVGDQLEVRSPSNSTQLPRSLEFLAAGAHGS